MLVLTLSAADRAVHIDLEDGRRVTVTLLEATWGQARVGFEAARSIRINRERVTAAIAAVGGARPPAAGKG